jgi:hypothetical protein
MFPIGIVLCLFFGGVALANTASDNGDAPPPEAELRVGDKVNGGRVIEVRPDEVVVRFEEPVTPQ